MYATSKVPQMQLGKTSSALHPWDRIHWSSQQVQLLYRDWAIFFASKQQLDKAAEYYNKSLELIPNDPKALYYRSKCLRHMAYTRAALKDGVAAKDTLLKQYGQKDVSAAIKLEINDGLYEMNQFESAKGALHKHLRTIREKTAVPFRNRLDAVNGNINDSLGETLGPFILKNDKIFGEVLKEIERETHVDPRPLWKILKAEGKCDVLSILEKEEKLISPLEKARRERAFKVFNQNYLNNSWIDVLFLKNIRRNPNMMLKQAKYSTPALRKLTNTKYKYVRRFMKMLEARSPMYNEQVIKCPKKQACERQREDMLSREQYQTRRNMLTILKTVRKLRADGKIERLSRYVESTMGDYVVLKTHRIMPWKFEFMNEIYNTLGITHVDRYYVPENFTRLRPEYRLLLLLRIPINKYKDVPKQFVFGDKSTYREPDAIDYSLLAYKNYVARLKKRIYFAEHHIEKAYLYHETASAHLNHSHFEDCCLAARQGIQEAKSCNSHLWRFLNGLLMCKAYAIQQKIERCREALMEPRANAQKLNNPTLIEFVEMCTNLNEEEILLKRRYQSTASLRRKLGTNTSSMSLISRTPESGESDEHPMNLQEFQKHMQEFEKSMLELRS